MLESIFIFIEVPEGINRGWVDFLNQWQTLIGSSLGVFFATLIPIGGWWYKNKSEKASIRKENLRRIEIAIIASIQETLNMGQSISTTINLIKGVILDIKKYNDDTTFAMERCNFPASGDIYKDAELKMLGLESYYLHNKLLMTDTMLKEINRIIRDMKIDFENYIRLNELMVNKTTPRNQRIMYTKNLESFVEVVEWYLNTQFPIAIKTLIQIKVYNELLRRNYYKTLNKYEGFKRFFWTVRDKKFQSLDNLDDIDNAIEPLVNNELTEAQKRKEKLQKTKSPPL